MFYKPQSKKFSMRNYAAGFTLVELLTVIAIIAILSSVVLTSLNSARAKSRDAKRISDLKQLELALALYHDANGKYPSLGGGGWWGNCSGFGSHGTSGPSGYIPDLAPTYIGVLPLDPKPVSTYGCYIYKSSDGVDYMLLAYYTVESYTQSNNPMPRPSALSELDFAVYSTGAINW